MNSYFSNLIKYFWEPYFSNLNYTDRYITFKLISVLLTYNLGYLRTPNLDQDTIHAYTLF